MAPSTHLPFPGPSSLQPPMVSHILCAREALKSAILKITMRGTWVVQSAKCPTLDFGSAHDLTVHEFEPCVGLYADGSELV